jgi:hypothetical protein
VPENVTESTNPTPPTASTQSAIKILSPETGGILTQTAVPVVVESPLDAVLELRVNGTPVDDSLIGRTEKDQKAGVKRQTWYGVVFGGGENTLGVYRQGEETPVAEMVLQVPMEPVAIRLSSEDKRIPADGISTLTLTGEFLDEQGLSSPWEYEVTLDTTAGEFVGLDQNADAPGFQVKAERGQFQVPLKAGLDAGVVRVRAQTPKMEGYYQLQFDTPLRKEPLLTGSVDVFLGRRGTNFFDDYRDFLPTEGGNGFEVDVDANGFGNASVGDWSVTGAFNSEHPLNVNCEGETGLFKAEGETCDRERYPSYGDNSTQTFITPSRDNGYLRWERSPRQLNADPDYFMWGDYNTEELSRASQTFSAVGRSFHGFKGNYNIGKLQITGFYGKDVEGFQRDTIAPDGTRGFYFLSRRRLIPGSEQIFLETEELNRPGTVLERKSLVAGADYVIDYDRGTLLFQDPVLRTDVDQQGLVLTRRIVATYQFEDSGEATQVVGGRVQYNFSRKPEQASWLGGTYFREDRGAQAFELYGADTQVSLGKDSTLLAEYAHSSNSLDVENPIEGNAYRVELKGKVFKIVEGRAYWRTAEEGFSNNATTSFVAGQTRYGVDLKAKIDKKTALRASYDHEHNFGTAPKPLDALEDLIQPGLNPQPGAPLDNSLTTVKAGVERTIGKATLGLDWIHRDRQNDLTNERIISDQLSTSVKYKVSDRLSLHAYNDFTLSNESDPLYPSRTTVGVDWQVHPGITLGLNQSYLDGGSFDKDWLTSLDISAEHTFKNGTKLHGQTSVLGDRGMGGRLGVEHGFQLTDDLKLDVAYEHIFNMPFKKTGTGQQFAMPYAVGNGASALGLTNGDTLSAGLGYTPNEDFQANARFDYRLSGPARNVAVTANALGKVTPSLTGVGQFKWASAANQTLEALGATTDLKVGLAYRNPKNDKFNALLRYEYRRNPSTIPETLLLPAGTGSTDHLLALEAIYAPNWRWEFYGKAGVRFSQSQLAKDFFNSSTVALGQLRVTRRISYQWDIAAEARFISQPTQNYSEFGGALELGYYLNPNLRVAAGYALGDINDPDLGGSRSRSGPYVGLTLKLDNNLFKDFGFGNRKRSPKTTSAETAAAAQAGEEPQAPEDSQTGTDLQTGAQSAAIAP